VGSVLGSNVNVVVDWDNIIKNPDFASNVDNYIEVIHTVSEKIPAGFVASNFGLGQLCEYEEVRKYIQTNVSTLRVTTDPSAHFWFEQKSKTLLVLVQIKGIDHYLSTTSGNFEKWGRLIETTMNLRPLRTQGAITRASQALPDVAKRLNEAVNGKLNVVVDWGFIEHPNFLALLNYIEIIHRITSIGEELLPTIVFLKENPSLRDIVKENVKTFTITVDPNNKINESEFAPCEYGVDYARVYYKDSKNDNIVTAVNLDKVVNNIIQHMNLHFKVEFLVTPERAQRRLQREQDMELQEREMNIRERAEANAQRDRQRSLDAQKEGNRIQEGILRQMRR